MYFLSCQVKVPAIRESRVRLTRAGCWLLVKTFYQNSCIQQVVPIPILNIISFLNFEFNVNVNVQCIWTYICWKTFWTKTFFCIISHMKTRITCSGSSSVDGEGCCCVVCLCPCIFYIHFIFDNSLLPSAFDNDGRPKNMYPLFLLHMLYFLYAIIYVQIFMKPENQHTGTGLVIHVGVENWEKNYCWGENKELSSLHCCWSGRIDTHTYICIPIHKPNIYFRLIKCWYDLILYILACLDIILIVLFFYKFVTWFSVQVKSLFSGMSVGDGRSVT